MKLNKNLSLCDLIALRDILERELKRKEDWMNQPLGLNYEDWEKRANMFHQDILHEKLKTVNREIDEIIDCCFEN